VQLVSHLCFEGAADLDEAEHRCAVGLRRDTGPGADGLCFADGSEEGRRHTYMDSAGDGEAIHRWVTESQGKSDFVYIRGSWDARSSPRLTRDALSGARHLDCSAPCTVRHPHELGVFHSSSIEEVPISPNPS
jgi:hypothetical protein